MLSKCVKNKCIKWTEEKSKSNQRLVWPAFVVKTASDLLRLLVHGWRNSVGCCTHLGELTTHLPIAGSPSLPGLLVLLNAGDSSVCLAPIIRLPDDIARGIMKISACISIYTIETINPDQISDSICRNEAPSVQGTSTTLPLACRHSSMYRSQVTAFCVQLFHEDHFWQDFSGQ